MELKTPSGRIIDANHIDYILWGKTVSGIPGTLVQLTTGDEVFLDNSEEEVIREMNEASDQSAVHRTTDDVSWVDNLGLH
jgi:hypothetical protein